LEVTSDAFSFHFMTCCHLNILSDCEAIYHKVT
jgi:hypothetical protein